MTRRSLFLLATAGLLALASCSLPGTKIGELNNGQFTYHCVDSSDAACEGFSGQVVMPELLAVGGAFDLEYVENTAGSSPVQVEPASEKMISGISGSFEFLRPGVSAVLARNTSGVVADFIHLRGSNIAHLDVAGPSSTEAVTQVQMTTDNDITLQVTPKDGAGATLGGALPYAWSTSDAEVVSLGVQSVKSRATLNAFKPGTATVEVSLPSGLKMAVIVTVKKGFQTSTSSSSASGTGGAGGDGNTAGVGGAGGAGGGQ